MAVVTERLWPPDDTRLDSSCWVAMTGAAVLTHAVLTAVIEMASNAPTRHKDCLHCSRATNRNRLDVTHELRGWIQRGFVLRQMTQHASGD
jgi:hypothetical protein